MWLGKESGELAALGMVALTLGQGVAPAPPTEPTAKTHIEGLALLPFPGELRGSQKNTKACRSPRPVRGRVTTCPVTLGTSVSAGVAQRPDTSSLLTARWPPPGFQQPGYSLQGDPPKPFQP